MSHNGAAKVFADFPANLRGLQFRPGDAGYTGARLIFNMQPSKATPALIARANDAEDVVCCVRFTSTKPFAIRSRGHSSDASAIPHDALILDMTEIDRLTEDAKTGVCRAESGVLLGGLDKGTQEYGLVVPAGSVSTTGVAGLTLGAGV